MIARGDLAVECGYECLAEAQEEILWISEAAHDTVIGRHRHSNLWPNGHPFAFGKSPTQPWESVASASF